MVGSSETVDHTDNGGVPHGDRGRSPPDHGVGGRSVRVLLPGGNATSESLDPTGGCARSDRSMPFVVRTELMPADLAEPEQQFGDQLIESFVTVAGAGNCVLGVRAGKVP